MSGAGGAAVARLVEVMASVSENGPAPGLRRKMAGENVKVPGPRVKVVTSHRALVVVFYRYDFKCCIKATNLMTGLNLLQFNDVFCS